PDFGAEQGGARHPESSTAARHPLRQVPQVLLRGPDFHEAANVRFVCEQYSISDQELCKLPGAWFEGAFRLPGDPDRARLEAEPVDRHFPSLRGDADTTPPDLGRHRLSTRWTA